MSKVACQLAENRLGCLKDKKIMIIGAGETGELTFKYLVKRSSENILVFNQTYEKALELTSQFGGFAVKFNRCFEEMVDADLVISSTSAPHYVIRKDDLKKVMQKRKKPILLIDIALPRDIEPEVDKTLNVHFYDLDHLKEVVMFNLKRREQEVVKASAIIEEEMSTLNFLDNLR